MLSPIPVTVTYQTDDKVFNSKFDIYAILLESIKIVKPPNNIAYRYGAVISHNGITVHAVYNNEEEEDITSLCSISPPDGNSFKGEYEAEVSYLGFTDSFSFKTIRPKNLKISKGPSRISYKSGDRVTYKGIELICAYADESTADVTEKCIFSIGEGEIIDYNSSVEITYTEGDSSVSTNLNLKIKQVTGIRVDKSRSKKTDIYTGDKIDFSDITIVADYDDGTTEEIDCDFYEVEIDEESGEEGEASPISEDSTLSKAKTKLKAEHKTKTSDGKDITFSIPLNEPELEKIEPLSAFVAPKIEVSPDDELLDYPMFTVGYSQISTVQARKFVQGTLIPWYITFGRLCENSYTEDAYGNKIGEWISYQTIPTDISLTVWFIDPTTGKHMGSKWIPFKYEPENVSRPPDPDFDSYSVWGWDTNTYDDFVHGRKGAPEIIWAMGPVYYEPTPSKRVTSIKPIIKNGEISWDITTSAIYPNEEEDSQTIVSVEDLPEETTNWLKLAESPSKLISCDKDKAVFEYISDGKVYKQEINLSSLTLPPIYDKCTGIYTYGNTTANARNSQTEENTTEVLHVARFSSDSDPNNDLYVTFKSNFSSPLVETVGLKGISVNDGIIYNVGDTLDLKELSLKAEYTNGTTRDISYDDVSSSIPDGTTVTMDMDTGNTISYTNEAGEQATGNYDIKYHALARLNITPPDKTRYELYEYFDYTGFQAIVEYTDGKTKDVTDEVKISSKKMSFVTPETESTVTVTYSEKKDIVTAEYELQLSVMGMWISKQPTKRVYRLGEEIDYTGLEIVRNNAVVDKTQCEFSVPEGTKVTPTTDEKIQVSFKQSGKTYISSLEIYIIGKDYFKKATGIEITQLPSKLDYIRGEELNFAGLRVMCSYEDGSKADVTGLVHFNITSPVTCDTSSKVEVSYSEEYSGSFTAEFNINVSVFRRLELIPPSYVKYKIGDELKFGSLYATIYYTDSRKADVSASVECEPSRGTVVTKDTSDTVKVSYTEGRYKISSSFELELRKVSSLSVTGVPQYWYLYGDILDLSNVMVMCYYLDGTSEDVTEHASFSPSNGSTISADTPSIGTVSYLDGEARFDIKIKDRNRFNFVLPVKTHYFIGETVNYTGLKVLYNTANSQAAEDVTRRAILLPPAGQTVTRESASKGEITVTVIYNDYTGYFTLDATPAVLDVTPPTKTEYRVGEVLNLTGMEVFYDEGNGNRVPVALNEVNLNPSRTTPLTVDITSVEVSISFGDFEVKSSFDITVKE